MLYEVITLLDEITLINLLEKKPIFLIFCALTVAFLLPKAGLLTTTPLMMCVCLSYNFV